jgi:hypothetical protein
MLSTHLAAAAALIDDVDRVETRQYASESVHASALSVKNMLMSAKVAELETVRIEVRARMAQTRAKFASAGLTVKVKDWDALSAKVEDRFNRVVKALDGIHKADNRNSRSSAIRHAKSELDVLYLNAQAHPVKLPAGQTPTLRSDIPQRKSLSHRQTHCPNT